MVGGNPESGGVAGSRRKINHHKSVPSEAYCLSVVVHRRPGYLRISAGKDQGHCDARTCDLIDTPVPTQRQSVLADSRR